MALTNNKEFSFNQCFDMHTHNDDVFQQTATELIDSSLKGINGTIFMYG